MFIANLNKEFFIHNAMKKNNVNIKFRVKTYFAKSKSHALCFSW
jgi:hypothetical protein